MLQNIALGLVMMFLIVASDYIGQNGWSIWLGIPLAIIYAWMIYTLAVAIKRGK